MAGREITNADLWSAVRGLGMYGKSRAELLAMADDMDKPDAPFASRVIVKAARQVAATKRAGE